jgi:hypothetical protein
VIVADVEIVGDVQHPDNEEYLKPGTSICDRFIALQTNTIR